MPSPCLAADHSECVNTRGSYFCRCSSGWIGDGKTCKGLFEQTSFFRWAEWGLKKKSSVYMSITWWMSFVTGNVHLPWEISTGPMFWTYTKHGPRSMDHFCGPNPWTSPWTPSMDYPCWPSLILEDEFYQSSKRILRNLNGQNFVNLYW